VQFAKALRPRVQRGEITCSVRVWMQPRVKVGGRYPVLDGEIEVDSIREIKLADVTAGLARRSGFDDVTDLMKTAKHGRGERVYLVEFYFVGFA
jgi:hypothetical protein